MSDAPHLGYAGQESDESADLAVILSRDEVMVILKLIGAVTLPGLDEEPIPGLTEEQQALALIIAERALRARGLAMMTERGKLLVQAAVLRLVGICALANRSIFVTTVASESGAAMQLIAHPYDSYWVLHTRPSPTLHSFQLVEGTTRLVEMITTITEWPTTCTEQKWMLELPSNLLESVGKLARDGNYMAAVDGVVAAGNEDVASKQLVELLAQPHIITVVQRVKAFADSSISLESVSFLHQEHELLMVVEPKQGKVMVQPRPFEVVEQWLAAFITNINSRDDIAGLSLS